MNEGSHKLPDPKDELVRRIETTASARFHAAYRLEQYNTYILWSIIVISFDIIFVNILVLTQTIKVPPIIAKDLLLYGNIPILFFSALLQTSNFNVRAKKFENIGTRLKMLSIDVKDENYEERKKEYDSIIGSQEENHRDIDHELTRAERDGTYELGEIKKLWIKSKVWFHVPKFVLCLIILANIYLIYFLLA